MYFLLCVKQEREPSPQRGTEESHDMREKHLLRIRRSARDAKLPRCVPAHLGVEEGARHH